jgi:predicted alpha/beta-hydrolase family hydrolase
MLSSCLARNDPVNFQVNGPSGESATIALTHDGGAGMGNPFMAFFAEGIATAGFRVVRFEFPCPTLRQ